MLRISKSLFFTTCLLLLFSLGCKPKESVEMRPEFIVNEFLIELSPQGNFASVKKEYARYGFQKKNKLSPRRELYLVTYDTAKIKPEKMYLKLKNNGQVQTVEFNKKTAPRNGRR